MNYIKKSVFTSYLNTIVSAVATLLLIPIIIKEVGISEYGEWALIFIFIGLAGFTDFGISKSLVILFNQTKENKVKGQYLALTFIFSIILFLFVLVILFALQYFGFVFPANNSNIKYLFFYGGGALFFSLQTNILRAILEYNLKVHWCNLGYMLLTLFQYTSLYFIIHFSSELKWWYFSTFITYIMIFIFHLIGSYKPIFNISFKIEKATLINFFKTVKGFSALTLTNSLNLPLSRIIVVYFSKNSASYGYFDTAVKFILMSNSLISSLSSPLFSLFSSGKDGEENRKLSNRIIGISFWLYVSGIILYFFAGNYFWQYYLGEKDVHTFFISVLGGLFFFCLTGVTEPATRLLWANGYSLLTAKIRFIIIPIMLLLVLVFYRNANPEFYILAFCLPYMVTSILSFYFYNKIIKRPFKILA